MWQKFKDFLVIPNESPVHAYGWYHFMWIGIILVSTFLLCFFVARKRNKKIDNIVITILGSLLIVLEIMKQICIYARYGQLMDFTFPYQLCSIPMFVWIPAVLLPEGKVKKAFMNFLATIGLFGGIAIYIYPETVLTTDIAFLLVHTMVWHGVLIMLGVYVAVSQRLGKDFKEDVIYPYLVFIGCVAIAIVINIVGNSYDRGFNLFFLNYKYGLDPGLTISWLYKPGDGIPKFILYVFEYLVAFFAIAVGEHFIYKLTMNRK